MSIWLEAPNEWIRAELYGLRWSFNVMLRRLEKAIWLEIYLGLIYTECHWDIHHLRDKMAQHVPFFRLRGFQDRSLASIKAKKIHLEAKGCYGNNSDRLRFGAVYLRAYPWMEPALLRRSNGAVKGLKKALGISPESRCRLGKSSIQNGLTQVRGTKLQTGDAYGVFATRELRAGTRLIRHPSLSQQIQTLVLYVSNSSTPIRLALNAVPPSSSAPKLAQTWLGNLSTRLRATRSLSFLALTGLHTEHR
ncbi:uncharacterized protein BDZ99DRAFT_42856 [Mytilinidion resinicola]|uniref:Uncharacterized protein n=1 Tax=Mytilinidion resinicola TaxID=574789 RepID=A0A6A6YLU9_9PEZI|nr:uncharacterized protein BDZ99DRAFT_42856 [Mytilinidion resinicola]KAF2808954.1 hypothetical protein BDZ99DRAFT_42856 [Mytilinidion resinicola]